MKDTISGLDLILTKNWDGTYGPKTPSSIIFNLSELYIQTFRLAKKVKKKKKPSQGMERIFPINSSEVRCSYSTEESWAWVFIP